MNIVAAQPKLVTSGIGLAVTFGIAAVVGITEAQQVHALGIHYVPPLPPPRGFA